MTKILLKTSHGMKSEQECLATYFTKHHSAKHHKRLLTIYIQTGKTSRSVLVVLLKMTLQECVDPADLNME